MHSPTVQNALRTADPRITQALGAFNQALDECRGKLAAIVEELITLTNMDPADAEDFRTDQPTYLADMQETAEYKVGLSLVKYEDDPEHDEDEGLYFIGNEPSPRLRPGLLRAAE